MTDIPGNGTETWIGMFKRKSDVLEVIGEKSLLFGIGGIIALLIGMLFYYYQREGGTMIGFAWVMMIAGVAGILYGAYTALQARKVTGIRITCVYDECKAKNEFTEFPTEDFRCVKCNRLVPVLDGKVLPVEQVRCGYCNTLNYYSEKNDLLVCESCDREIPLSTGAQQRHVARAYAITDDERLYELVLVAQGNKTEEVIATLQTMLALNRNQVKNILEDLPAVLLTGIPRKKAELLSAQLAIHDAAAEFHPLS
ncbi:MAG: ABC transporter permease [Fimbriimonadaceae bacterium]|nr:ABC transporter permease [Fimbriimonadaceae bacterium]